MSLFSTDKIWDRTGIDEIGARAFNIIFSLTTVYGLLIYGVLASLFVHAQLGVWDFVIALVLAIIGAVISSMDLPLNVIGYTVMAGALGYISGPFIGQYKIVSVADIAFATLIVTAVLGLAGFIYPKSLANWGSLLFTGLIALLIVQIALPILFSMAGAPVHSLNSILDWLGVFLFSAYIVFDFNRAQFLPKTAENAISCGVAVFLDIVNLFIRLLELFGVKNSDD
jgi:FtsH-binding integral membrane protein